MADERTSPFAAMLGRLDGPAVGGLLISEWRGMAIGAVMPVAGRTDAADERLRAFAGARGAHILAIGPALRLALDEAPGDAWLDEIDAALDGTATVFDQSDGLGLLRLDGRDASRLLQKGFFVDLQTALSADGMSVTSLVSHITVTAWRIAPDLFGLAVPRSYAGSFWHWLTASAAAEAIPLRRAA